MLAQDAEAGLGQSAGEEGMQADLVEGVKAVDGLLGTEVVLASPDGVGEDVGDGIQRPQAEGRG